MGATLQLADEKHGYTLTDRATYLTWRDKLQLFPMVEGDSLLYNVYHVLELNPKNASRINVVGGKALADRSEEHTSELQSRGHLVCRLLLEKKKKKQITIKREIMYVR